MTSEQASLRVKRLGDRNATAFSLARLLSFAALVEPALIRRMRLDLLPASSAADEADLWFSDLVQSRSPGGLVFFPEVADLLRKGLTAELAAQAWSRTREMHGHLRRALQIEEELTYLGMEPGANQTRIGELLGTVVSALIGGAAGLANWAGRAVPRLPAAVQNMEPAAALRIASDLRLGRTPDWRVVLSSANQMPAWIGALLPSLRRVRLQVTYSSREIVLGPATSDPNTLFAHCIEVPDTPTIAVEVKWTGPQGPRSKILFVERGVTSQPERIDPGPAELVTLANEKWTLIPSAVGVSQKAVKPPALAAYTDGYAVTLHWRSHEKILGCLGFAIARRRRNPSSSEPEPEETLASQIGFPDLPPAGGPSSTHPIQRFHWIDRPPRGTEYSYRVTPVIGAPSKPVLMQALASAWTSWIWVGTHQNAAISVAFNRTFENAASLGLTHSNILEISGSGFRPTISRAGGPVREALGGDLLSSLRSLLSEAAISSQTVYAAMFEMDDPEIIQLLAQMKNRANVVLSKGADSPRRLDRNIAARQQLRKAGVRVYDRIFRAGRLAHNKFLIVCDPSHEPHTVWTGNASWTSSALCARSNAAVTVVSKPLAAAYLAYWNHLAADPGHAELSRWTANGQSPVQVGSATVKPWFTPTRDLADIYDAARYIQGARQGILFLLSEPGLQASLVATILEQKNLFVVGMTRKGPNVTLHGKGKVTRISGKDSALPVLVSLQQGKRPSVPLGAALQSRLIVIDPLSSHPVVLIGSHAFGARGSRTNDENFLIIENDPETARRCAAHIDAYYRHYAFRASAPGTSGKVTLRPDDNWQDHLFESAERAELAFWVGDDARAFVAPAASASPPISPARKPAPAEKAATKKRVRSAGTKPPKREAARRTERRKAPAKPAAAKKPVKAPGKSTNKRSARLKRRPVPPKRK